MVTNSGGAVPADPLPSVDYFPGRGGFYIIGNVLRVEVDLPLVIAQDLQIEKPTDEQLNIIHQLFAGSPWGDDLRAGFESQVIVAAANGPTVSYSYVPLDQLAWRYLVLNHTGNGNDAQWFFYAANLVEPWLYSVGHALTSEQGGRGKRVGWGFDHMAVHRQFFGPSRFPSLISPPALDQAAAERLRAAYSAFQGLDRVQHPGVYRSVELLSLFNRLPLANFLDVLALFMVIEMLLTHAPNDREVGDSLTHQIREKVPFVMDQMGEVLDYSCFGDTDPKSVWTALYGYRSALAHGNEPDFQRGKLRVLKDAATADQFLGGATRRLVRHAIQEPQFFEGLKPV